MAMFAKIVDTPAPKKPKFVRVEEESEDTLETIFRKLEEKDGGCFLNDVSDDDDKLAVKSAMDLCSAAGSISYHVSRGTLDNRIIDTDAVTKSLGDALRDIVRLAQAMDIDPEDIVEEAMRGA